MNQDLSIGTANKLSTCQKVAYVLRTLSTFFFSKIIPATFSLYIVVEDAKLSARKIFHWKTGYYVII
jgi:hypothetical protein